MSGCQEHGMESMKKRDLTIKELEGTFMGDGKVVYLDVVDQLADLTQGASIPSVKKPDLISEFNNH